MIGADADLDRLAEDLRVDGVVVDRVLGSGEAQEANDRIAALIREVPFPVYVALIEEPDGLPDSASGDATDALAGLLNRRLGDGFYVLQMAGSSQQVWSYGLGADPSLLSLSAYANADVLDAAVADLTGPPGTDDYVSTPPSVEAEAQVLTAEELVEIGRRAPSDDGGYPSAIADADADRLAERAVALAAVADWRPASSRFVEVRTASAGLSAFVGSLAAVVVALLLGQSLRGWPRLGRGPRKGGPQKAGATTSVAAPPPDRDEERERAVELVDALATSLAATDWDEVRDRDVAGRALTARDAAEGLLDSRDVADLIGAQVLARTGARDLARGRRGSGEPSRTCFFDPRHREATTTASWRLGDGEVDVPCCVACGAAVIHDGTPAHLRLPTRRGTRPYWERDDVWARTGFGAVSDDLARDVLADRAEQR